MAQPGSTATPVAFPASSGGCFLWGRVFRTPLRWQAILLLASGLLARDISAASVSRPPLAVRATRLAVPAEGRSGLTLVSAASVGIQLTNSISQDELARNSNLMNGAGLAMGDFDGDGLCDIYFCTLQHGNHLYRNLGAWRFQDVTGSAGVACAGRTSRGAVFADVNGDGHLDLVVSVWGGSSLCLINDGHGHFAEQALPPGLVSNPGSTSLALADVDGDGRLDIYLCNFGVVAILRDGVRVTLRMVGGRPTVTGRYANRLQIIDGQLVEFGEPDVLYHNDGPGGFSPVSWTDGTFLDESGQPLAKAPWDFGLSVQMRDLNGDGAPDLYVCNDFETPDRIWLNDGHGHFRALPTLALRHTSAASMGVDAADIDRDGRLDLFVVEMLARDHRPRTWQAASIQLPPARPGELLDRPQYARNTLLWNRGDGTYAEIADLAHVAASDWSWQPAFLDVDLDGYEDILVINGISHDLNHLDFSSSGDRMATGPAADWRSRLPPFKTPNALFRNRGDLTFEEVGARWGFDSSEICNGIGLADLDGDGDLDVAINCLNAPPLLYRNDSVAPRLAVRLNGTAPNTKAIGAQIKVLGGAVPMQSQEVICGGYFLSGPDTMRTFAAGSVTNRMTLEITWRNGTRTVVSNVVPNHLYEIAQAPSVPDPPASAGPAPSALAPPFFRDLSTALAHTHLQEFFDDFARQPLLPKRLSQLGPGVAWFDLDGDGREELILGAGQGGELAVFHVDGPTGFRRLAGGAGGALPDDSAGLAGWVAAPGQRVLLAAVGNYRSETNPPRLLAIPARATGLSPGFWTLAPSQARSSFGPLAVADYDGDGDLDVFVGGRVVAGRYPEGASSALYRNSGGKLEPDEANNRGLEKIGMVSGAVFTDLDGDGWPELVVACEWASLRVFKNNAGRLSQITAELGLDAWSGWWNSVTAGDLDGDGRLDLIAGNWGLNSSYEASPKHPVHLYFADFGAGRVDLLEGHYASELRQVVPYRNLTAVGGALPFVRERFPTHVAYAQASLEEILGERLPQAGHCQVNTLASGVFLNRGDHFEFRPFPTEAQFAPVFGVSVADFDGDGSEDLLLAQNFFATRPGLSRLDAGRALWLRGDGQGRLVAVPGQNSGILVYGEQRGCAVADFDGDGRTDLVVTQNGAPTKLYQNQGARPGLRVRLEGPPGNPDGVGAVLRLLYQDTARLASGPNPPLRRGSAREIHAGSGYWSQDALVQVLPLAGSPAGLEVRWPGGRLSTVPLRGDQKDLVVTFP